MKTPKSHPTPIPRGRRFVYLLATSLFCLFLLLLLVEGAARLAGSTNVGRRWLPVDTQNGRQDDVLHIYSGLPCIQRNGYYLHQPGIYPRRSHGRLYRIHINDRGFRGPFFTEPRLARGLRIACLGGSTTLGIESDEEHTYPRILQAELNRGGAVSRVEVLNAGLSNAGIAQVVSVFYHEILPLAPDIITIYSGVNNIDRSIDRLTRGATSIGAVGSGMVYRFKHHFMFVRYTEAVARMIRMRGDQADFGLQELVEFEERLTRLADLAASHGVRLLVIKQGIHLAGFPLPGDEQELARIERIKARGRASQAELRWWFQSRLSAVAERVAEARSLLLIDPVPELHRQANRYFVDFCHLSPEGNRLLGSAIATALRPFIGGENRAQPETIRAIRNAASLQHQIL